MTCRYTLKIGTLYLAPRKSIAIVESADFEKLADESQASDCATACSNNSKREFGFTIHFLGGGSLDSAWSLYNQLKAQLLLACTQQVLLQRRVCDEDILEYQVTGGSTRMVDTINQFTCERVLTIEFTVKLKAKADLVQPVIIGVTIPPPTVVLTGVAFTVSPVDITVTINAPTISSSDLPAPDPVFILVSIIAPTVVLV